MNEYKGSVIRSKPFQAFLTALRIFLGSIFVYAGVTKIIDPTGFALAVYNYHILPEWLVNVTAIMLPWVEIIAGASLVIGLWTPGGTLIISGLLLIFTISLGFNLSRGLDIACGCFSTSSSGEHITWWYILRDSSLLAGALLLLLYGTGLYSMERWFFNTSNRSL